MSKNVTPADVAAKAAEEKLVTVPAQAEGEKSEETPDLTVLEGGKKSLKERLASVGEKLKANKNALVALGAVAAVATVAVVKYVKQRAEETVLELVEDEDVADGTDESAA